MLLYSNIGAPEVYCNTHNISAPSIFDYFPKCGFSAIGACAKMRANMEAKKYIIW